LVSNESGGEGICFELVLTAQDEGINFEPGDVPLEKAPEKACAPFSADLQAEEDGDPGLPDAVDPGAEFAMLPREVAELVGDDGAELLRGEGGEERQADVEDVAIPSKESEAWELGDRGVHIGGEINVMNARGFDGAGESIDGFEERSRVVTVESKTLRRGEANFHGAEDDAGGAQEWYSEDEEGDNPKAAAEAGAEEDPDHEGEDGENECEKEVDEGVAEGGEEEDFFAIARGI
jgi:hypothetical protein